MAQFVAQFVAQFMAAHLWFEPLSLWSLWVPLALLGLVLLAALYFVRVGSSR